MYTQRNRDNYPGGYTVNVLEPEREQAEGMRGVKVALIGGVALSFVGLGLFLLLPYLLWWKCRQNPENDCVSLIQVFRLGPWLWFLPIAIVGLVLIAYSLQKVPRLDTERKERQVP